MLKKFFVIVSLCFALCCRAKPPSIMLVYPAGGQAGTTFNAIIGALDADSATGISISGGAISAKILKISNMPQDRLDAAARRNEAKGMKFVYAEITIDKSASPGVRDLKLTSREGASSRYFFHVDSMPEITEQGVHSSINNAQEVKELPVVVNGQIYEGERDFYKFNLTAGKTYVFDMRARQIRPYLADAVPGWFQATMRIYDESGNSLMYVDDFQNSPDPVAIFTPKRSGSYYVELKDSLYRGRDDFVYRLRCGELPFISYIFPCGGDKNKETSVELFGVNLPARKIKIPPSNSSDRFREIFVKSGALESNRVKFCCDTFPEKILHPSENPPEIPSKIPCVFNGIIKRQYQKFFVKFNAKKGDELNFETFTSRLGYPVDTKLSIYKGDELVASNDDIDDMSFGLVTAQFDSRITHKFAEGGTYVLKLEDSRNMGGDDFVFRLKISKPEKQIDLSVSPGNPQIAKGSYAPLKISANKRGGWDGEIEVFAKNLPEGLRAQKCLIKKGKSFAYLILEADEGAKVKSFSPVFSARATVDSKEVTLPVKPSEELTQAFFINHTLSIENVEMNVLEKASLKLEWINLPNLPISINAGNLEELTLKVTKLDGFKGKFRIAAYRSAPGVQVLQSQIKDDSDEVTVRLKGNPNAIGRIEDTLFIMAAYTRKGKSYMVLAPPIPYRVNGKVQFKLTNKK